MVKGLQVFQEAFMDFEDSYVLIGGAAIDLLMGEAGIEFRVTRDLDIVITLEATDRQFGNAFWEFVHMGGYQQKEQNDQQNFYRFVRPSNEDYPAQLELFSRVPDTIVFAGQGHLTPIPFEDEIASLSAIVLDDTYYHFLRTQYRRVQQLNCVGEGGLIPLKARAWLDLTARMSDGVHISDREIRKHRNDVLRLSQLLTADSRVETPVEVQGDLRTFINALRSTVTDEILHGLGIGDSAEEVFSLLNVVFGLTDVPASKQ
jgi:hypothetical protein